MEVNVHLAANANNNCSGTVVKGGFVCRLFLIWIIAFVMMQLTVKAQTNSTIDSLKTVFANTTDATQKIKAGISIFNFYKKNNSSEAIKYLKEAYALVKEKKYSKEQLTCEQRLAAYYKDNKEFAAALSYVKLAQEGAKLLNDSLEYMQAINTEGIIFLDQKKDSVAEVKFNHALKYAVLLNNKQEEARLYNNLSVIYKRKLELAKALELSEKSLQIKKALSDTLGIAYSYYGMANILTDLGKYDDALKYTIDAAKYFELKNEQKGLLAAYSVMGSLYFRYLKINKQAIAAYHQSIALNIKFGIKNNLDIVYNNLANVYKAEQQMDSALFYYELAYQKAVEFENSTIITLVENNLADLYLKLDKPQQSYKYAIAAFQKSIKQEGAKINIFSTASTLSKVYLALGMADSAYYYAKYSYNEGLENKYSEHYLKYVHNLADVCKKTNKFNEAVDYYNEVIAISDSISSKERVIYATELNTKYETAKKENEITKLNSDKKIQQLQLEKQKALLAGNVLEAKQKQQEINLLNQQQQIQELKLTQQREALALKELESQTKDRQLKITEQEKELKEAELTQQRFSKNLILAGAFVLLAFAGLGFNLYRINTKRKNEREKFQLQNQLSEMRLEALRSQMNPHFIFNALNSINRYIIRSDRETASEYLIKFSKLMRLILENSKSSFIPLANELEALKLYVEMELLRFDNKFDFNINIASDVLQEKTQIPPMVLQPFIENAIWHGLMNKKEKGTITVSVESKSVDKLFVVIEDNGVGRQKAGEQRSQHANTGKSFGMQITRDRLAGINGTDKQFRIIDLTDNNNNPAGTRVELEITTIAA
ncbi:MAG TPA: tetratricopeptide repeat protein [Bacteroidia bacterium]|nr:tetratricopeptide repeat protein [Bacteroidia bacterium]